MTPMPKAPAQSSRCGPRWGLVSVLCALVVGIVALFGVETDCSEPSVEHSSHGVAHPVADVEIGLPTAVVEAGTWTRQADIFDGSGDLLVCALIASFVALLLVAVRARRSGATWLVLAIRSWLRPPTPRSLLSPSLRTVAPLRC